MAFDPDELPVVTLFRGKTFNGLTCYLIREVEKVPTEWTRANALGDDVGFSTTAFQRKREQAICYGLLEREQSEENASMPRIRIPTSPTVTLLRSFHMEYDPNGDPDVADDIDEVFLPDLMEPNGRARLIGWFLAAADHDEQYSISGMDDASPVGHTTVRDHIKRLSAYGIVTEHEASRGSMTYTTYQFNTESAVAAVLYELNENVAACREHYESTGGVLVVEDDTDEG